MATAASEEAQAMTIEIVPAAPDPDPDPEQQQQQQRDVTAHQYYKEAVAEAADDIKMLLSEVQALRARMSQLLGPAGPRHVGVATGDYKRRCLAFLETEMSITAAFLTTLNPQHYYSYYKMGEGRLPDWSFVSLILREFDLSCHTLMQRASPCCYRRKSHTLPLFTVMHYTLTEHPSKYTHLLLTSSDLGIITPQLTEADALPLVGIDGPAKKIMRWLAHQGKMDMNLKVMSIIGPVGIGKTTLAVELHNRLRRETSRGSCHFQCNVMVQVPRGNDSSIGLLQGILSQVSPSDPSPSQAKEVLVHLVSECLRDKRYFIIIDGLREESDWHEIKWAFPDTNNLGSRILITTQVTSIAEAFCSRYSWYGHACDGLVLKMEPLNQNDSTRLLLAKVGGSVDGCLPHNMKLHCDEILRRCDGIPLFIIGMADWLIKEQLQQQQEGVVDQDKEQENFAIYCQGQVPYLPERLEQSLSFAFNNDLPNNELRPLLLSMSMFPYGYKFDKDRLIHKQMVLPWWQAEHFFSKLVDSNVITCVASNCKHNNVGDTEACQWQVNHFMHQFLVSKSAEIGFIFTTATLSKIVAAALPGATGHGNEPSSSRMPRRLALHHPDPLLPSLLETMDLSQTRSLAVSGAVSGIPLKKFVNLVGLDLEGWENLKDEHLLQVCRSKMIFLEYLSVRNTRVSKLPHEIKELPTLRSLDVSYTQITELPHEIKEMWNLRTLDVSYTQISELPLELFKLTNLEHLDLRGTQISQLPKKIVGLRGNLVGLFVGSEGSVNSVETAMPQDVRRLYKLQTLATVDLIQQPASFVRALGDLQNLKVLVVTWSSHQSTDRDYCNALLSSIGKWRSLKSLTIHCGLGCSMEFLGSLKGSRVLWSLKKFKVTAGRFASVPPWIHGLEQLAFVQITVCNKQTTSDDLKILGDLPKLQCLILGLDFVPQQPIVIGNEGFRELQWLSVDCPMPWLTFSTGAMPKLTYLQLKFCSTPASQIYVPSGISNLHMLTEVALCYNAQYINSRSIKMTVEAVSKQISEHINLTINGIGQDDVQEVHDEVTEVTIGTSSRTNAGAEVDAQAVGEDATAAVQCGITEAES